MGINLSFIRALTNSGDPCPSAVLDVAAVHTCLCLGSAGQPANVAGKNNLSDLWRINFRDLCRNSKSSSASA